MAVVDGMFDAVIIGGGFYGAAIAIYLAKQRDLKHILLVEREQTLLTRASYNNQARVHNGYHYPRSFTTAYRSRVNLPRFVHDYPFAVSRDITMLYAIARRNSKVTAKQFVRFCRKINAEIRPVDSALRAFFEPRFIEDVFQVEEYVFDATKLKDWAENELNDCGVRIRLETRASSISGGRDKALHVALQPRNGLEELVTCRYVFNCCYSGLNQFRGEIPLAQTRLKHEITELALVQSPAVLENLGITVMDGPFFSLMPFPSRGLHTLSHVRYTPHLSWEDESGIDPYQKLDNYARIPRVERMVRDVGRYLPAILEAKYVDSLFEIKTVLVKNEGDDGRPILFEKHPELPGCFSVLGGKIDNLYDVLEKLEAENFQSVNSLSQGF
jgi:glycine/D-amino acid oxidase-like deaminating enzyme